MDLGPGMLQRNSLTVAPGLPLSRNIDNDLNPHRPKASERTDMAARCPAHASPTQTSSHRPGQAIPDLRLWNLDPGTTQGRSINFWASWHFLGCGRKKKVYVPMVLCETSTETQEEPKLFLPRQRPGRRSPQKSLCSWAPICPTRTTGP